MADHPPLDLATLQRRLAEVLASVRHPRIGAALALCEEAGEVSDLVLKRECYGEAGEPGALAGELCDVLCCLCELATLYGIDLEGAAREKLADLARRAPRWAETLGPALAAARARMD